MVCFSGSGGEHFHHARLAELKPSTTYWFVIESDGHVIKRTVPIRNEKKDSTGVVYVGEGGLGVPQRKPDLSRWYLRSPGMATRGHHVMNIRFTPEKIDYKVVLLDRSIADQSIFRPRKK